MDGCTSTSEKQMMIKISNKDAKLVIEAIDEYDKTTLSDMSGATYLGGGVAERWQKKRDRFTELKKRIETKLDNK